MSAVFKELPSAIRKDTEAWKAIFDASEPQNIALPGDYGELSAFDKLLIIRMIRPDKLVPAVCSSKLQHTKGPNVFVFLVDHLTLLNSEKDSS